MNNSMGGKALIGLACHFYAWSRSVLALSVFSLKKSRHSGALYASTVFTPNRLKYYAVLSARNFSLSIIKQLYVIRKCEHNKSPLEASDDCIILD